MWLDWAGGILLLAGSTLSGVVLSKSCKLRVSQLASLLLALNMFENEIRFLSTRLAEAFLHIGEMAPGDVSGFFVRAAQFMQNEMLPANEAWQRSVDIHLPATALKPEDGEVIKEFGRMLGNTDMEGQIKNIRHARACIDVQHAKAQEERKRNESMYRGLGFLLGLTGLILLI